MAVLRQIVDILFVLTIVALPFIPRKGTAYIVWGAIFVLNIGIRVYLIQAGHMKDKTISKLEQQLDDANDNMRAIEGELQTAREMVAPPTLSLLQEKVEITKTDSGYTALLMFKPSKNKPLGQIVLIAKVIGESSGKIVDFWPRAGPAFLTGADSKKISEDGNKARLIFQLIGIGHPEVELKMSEASKVLISGSHDLKAQIIDIK